MIPTFARKAVVIDIGSWTVDIMPVVNKQPDDQRCSSLPKGIITCMREMNRACVRRFNYELDESDIEHYIRYHQIDGIPIETIMDDVRENDQCLFFVGVTIILMAESKEELASVCETVETIGKRNSCVIDTHLLKQREALNTALPIGVRQVETMRTLLTQSLAVLMPTIPKDR